VRRVVALAAVALLGGCGSQRAAPQKQPRLPQALATAWRSDADAVAAALAAGDRCLAQRRVASLQTSVIEAVNARRLASQFQEPLLGAVNELASRIRCAA
jgi:hypothetical protein